jgi:hypothetical protein
LRNDPDGLISGLIAAAVLKCLVVVSQCSPDLDAVSSTVIGDRKTVMLFDAD